MREFLYSPGYGAGWWSYNGTEISFDDFCCHPILIKAVKDGKFSAAARGAIEDLPEFQEWWGLMMEKYSLNEDDIPYTGGLKGCIVGTTDVQIHITEYDGAESYVEDSNHSYWY